MDLLPKPFVNSNRSLNHVGQRHESRRAEKLGGGLPRRGRFCFEPGSRGRQFDSWCPGFLSIRL